MQNRGTRFFNSGNFKTYLWEFGFVAGLCLLAGLLFGFTFRFPQTFEDYMINSRLSHVGWDSVLKSYGSVYSVFSPFYRPTAELTQWLLIWIFGVGNFGQHVAQYIFPCLSCLLLFKIVFGLTKDYLAAGWCGFWFLISGVQMTHFLMSSTYIFDRTALFFLLLALWGVMNRRLIVSVPALALALTCKETAVIFPGLYGAMLLALWVSEVDGMRRWWDILQGRLLEIVCLAVLFVGFLGYRNYMASAAGVGFVDLMRGGQGRYDLEWNAELLWRNFLILSAYTSEFVIWWTVPEKSFDVAYMGVPKLAWLVFPALCVVLIVVALVQFFRRKTGVHSLYIFGGLWFFVAIFPFLFIVPQFRVLNYLAYIPSVGFALVMSGLTAQLTRFVCGNGRRKLLWVNGILVLMVCWMVREWQAYSVYSNSWLRAHLTMGARSADYLVQTMQERAMPLADKQLHSVGVTNAQSKALPILDLLGLHITRPQRFNAVSVFDELWDLKEFWTIPSSPQQLVVFPLTDRFAIWSGGKDGGRVLAGLNLINGDFSAGENTVEGWRPLGWVPAGVRKGSVYETLATRRGVRCAEVLPGMNDGLEQKFVWGEGRYEVSFGAASGSAAAPTVDIRRQVPEDIVERFVFPATEELTLRSFVFNVETTAPYSMVLGSTGTSKDWMNFSDVSFVRVGDSVTEQKEPVTMSQLLPPLDKVNGLKMLDESVYLLQDDSTTAAMGVFHFLETESVPDWTRYVIRLDARESNTDFVDVMVTPEYDNGVHYEDNDWVVMRLPISEDWETVSGAFSLKPYCKKIRLHIAPHSGSAGVEGIGSIQVRGVELWRVGILLGNEG